MGLRMKKSCLPVNENMDLEVIVRTYIMQIRPRAKAELDWFRNQPTLVSAIGYAGLAINCTGKRCAHHRRLKRYAHQRRLKRKTLLQAKKVLLTNTQEIEKAKTFDELFTLIESLVLNINGIGELYVYDTSLRIGAKLGLLPTKVYLHRGTREGAKNLNIGIKGNTKSIEVSSLPPEFQLIKPHEIEDALCIFKDDFVKTDVDVTLEMILKRCRCN